MINPFLSVILLAIWSNRYHIARTPSASFTLYSTSITMSKIKLLSANAAIYVFNRLSSIHITAYIIV